MDLWYKQSQTRNLQMHIRVKNQLCYKKSDYQKIEVLDTPTYGKILTFDGNVVLTEKDEYIYDEMVTHVPMMVHPDIRNVLLVGDGDGGVIHELLKYDFVENIDLVELDDMVNDVCEEFFPMHKKALEDERVCIHPMNAQKFLRKCKNRYDLVIVDANDPFGPGEGTYTREFYGACYSALKEDGIMICQQGCPYGKDGVSTLQKSHQQIADIFPICKVYQAHIPSYQGGYWLFGFASKKYHPIDDFKPERFEKLDIRTDYYTSHIHVGAFYLPAFVERILKEVEDNVRAEH